MMYREDGTNMDRQGGTNPATDVGLMARLRDRAEPLLRPSPGLVILVALVFAADQYLYQLLGSHRGFQGAFDETDQLLTVMLLFWALFPRFGWRELIPALLASVLIDVDHIPGQFGSTWLTDGTPRPYGHSLLTVAAILLLALLWRRPRIMLLCIALGVSCHLWRDLAEPAGSAVSLFWPITDEGVHLNPVFYLTSVGLFVVVALARAVHADKATDPTGARHAPT